MLTLADVPAKWSLTKNLVSDQTFTNITTKIGTPAFAAGGLGMAAASSSVIIIHGGGFSDQRVTAVMKYISPTTSGAENLGVVLRLQSLEDAGTTTYYYARIQAGVARISRFVASAVTTLSSQAFVLAQDTNITITFSAVGTALSATFDAGGSPATINLSAVDSQITGGLMAVRGTSTAFLCSSFTAEQL